SGIPLRGRIWNWSASWRIGIYVISIILMYLCLLFTRSQSGFVGFWVGFLVMIGIIVYREFEDKLNFSKILKSNYIKIIFATIIIFGAFTFVFGSGVSRIDDARDQIIASFSPKSASSSLKVAVKTPPPAVGELG